MTLRTLDVFNSPVIQSRILSEHSQYIVKLHTLHATLNYLMFSLSV
jgi:hypothetical protein